MSSWANRIAALRTSLPPRGALLVTAPASQLLEERHFRFSVKCDRARLRSIEAAALAAGVSPQEFVQAHFDRVLEHKHKKPGSGIEYEPEDLRDFAVRHQVTPAASRLWHVMASHADGQGMVTMIREHMLKVSDLGHMHSLDTALLALKEAGVLEKISSGNAARPSTWLLKPEGRG